MAKGLREQLVGAWKLISYVEKPVDGSEPFYPLGREPQGIIMYTPDGYMSAQLMRPGRSKFESGDWFRGSDEEIKEEAQGYIAYCGPFHTDEEKQHLTHSMFVSLFPNWLGQTQPRVVKIDGDMLHLSTAVPIKSGGKETNSHLTWRRAEVVSRVWQSWRFRSTEECERSGYEPGAESAIDEDTRRFMERERAYNVP